MTLQRLLTAPATEFVEGVTTVAHWDRTEPPPFHALPERLKGLGTTVIYISPQGYVYHLAGPRRGAEGVSLSQQMLGDQLWPFDIVLEESAYLMGANIQKVNINKRVFNIGIVIGRHNPPMTEYQYRMAEDHWWEGQDENNDGWLGFWTRFSGWRWIPVRPESAVKSTQKMDTTAFGNNVSTWDITLLAARPYFTKPALYKTWSAKQAARIWNPFQKEELYTGTIHLANRGNMPSYVQYLVSAPGQAYVQDNLSNRMVELPFAAQSDGAFLCDTEPGKRTLTGTNDPVDNLLYDRIRQSKILDFFLHDLGQLGLPMQMRFNDRFIHMIPPRTAVALTVQHTNSAGSITAFVAQRFKRSR